MMFSWQRPRAAKRIDRGRKKFRATCAATLAVVASGLLVSTETWAAPITWGLPFMIDSPDDIDTSFGRLHEAVNYTDAADTMDDTVNTGTEMITFVRKFANDPSLSHSSLQGDAAGALNDSYDNSPPRFYNTLTGDTALDDVLNGQVWTGQPASTVDVIQQRQIVVTLSGLVAGQDYQLQVLGPADDRSCCAARTVNVDDLQGNTALLTRSTLHSVLGTFTADAATQQFAMTGVAAISGNDPGLDGYVLRVIPEPSSSMLIALGLGIVGLVAGRRSALP